MMPRRLRAGPTPPERREALDQAHTATAGHCSQCDAPSGVLIWRARDGCWRAADGLCRDRVGRFQRDWPDPEAHCHWVFEPLEIERIDLRVRDPLRGAECRWCALAGSEA